VSIYRIHYQDGLGLKLDEYGKTFRLLQRWDLLFLITITDAGGLARRLAKIEWNLAVDVFDAVVDVYFGNDGVAKAIELLKPLDSLGVPFGNEDTDDPAPLKSRSNNARNYFSLLGKRAPPYSKVSSRRARSP